MFSFRKKTQDQNTPTPRVPQSEEGCTAHRVVLNLAGAARPAVAYVFTRAARLDQALLHPDNVAFAEVDHRHGEGHEPDCETSREEDGDFDYLAAQECAGMRANADKVVVFGVQTVTTADVVRTLCRDFGARSHPQAFATGPRPANDATPAPRRVATVAPARPVTPETCGLCG